MDNNYGYIDLSIGIILSGAVSSEGKRDKK